MAVTIERMHRAEKASNERPIRILFNDKPMAVSQGTPENIRELAIGFLLSEGLLSDRAKLLDIKSDAENAWVNVLSDEKAGAPRAPMHRVTSAGCAQSALLNATNHHDLCRTSVYSHEDGNPITFKADDLAVMMEQLCLESPKRNSGECVHGCGIGNKGELVLAREDIGRHNAMDKLIGQAWLDYVDMSTMAMFTTGRISYEMALKAAQAGVPVLVSHKSVTDSAVAAAEEMGLTLVGKCRNDSLQVLTCHDRIV